MVKSCVGVVTKFKFNYASSKTIKLNPSLYCSIYLISHILVFTDFNLLGWTMKCVAFDTLKCFQSIFNYIKILSYQKKLHKNSIYVMFLWPKEVSESKEVELRSPMRTQKKIKQWKISFMISLGNSPWDFDMENKVESIWGNCFTQSHHSRLKFQSWLFPWLVS